jgi:carbamoyltransferase
VVTKKNIHFYNILTKFYEKTGIPVLMNTSFNGHGEPIINSPKDALDHLSNGTIDYLIINNKICNI